MKKYMNLLNKQKREDILFCLVLIDILILPYFKFFVMPMSLPFLAYWFIKNFPNIKKDFSFNLFIIISVGVLFSTIISYFYVPKYINGYSIWPDNFKRPFQLLSSFLYFFYAKQYGYRNKLNVVNILLIFILAVDILAIVSVINVGVYFDIKELLGVRDPFINRYYTTTTDEFIRYSYLFVDPNSIGYMIGAVGIYLISNHKLSVLKKVFIIMSISLVLMTCMSTGALLSIIITFIIIVVLSINRIKIPKRFRIKNISTFWLIMSLLTILMMTNIESINKIKDINMFKYGINRMLNNEGGGRTNIYRNILNEKSILNNLILGEGYTLIINKNIKRPHSDNLRIIYAYGLIVYIAIMIFLFRIRRGISLRQQLFFIPAFICFSINTLIDEQKVFVIFLLLIALVEQEHKGEERNEKTINNGDSTYIQC